MTRKRTILVDVADGRRLLRAKLRKWFPKFGERWYVSAAEELLNTLAHEVPTKAERERARRIAVRLAVTNLMYPPTS